MEVICEIYQPPNRLGSFLDSLDTFLNTASPEGLTVYTMGDINVSLLGFPNINVSVDLLSLYLIHSFVPLINRPTKVTPSISLIDVLFTNDISNIDSSVTNVLTCAISDHYLIAHVLNSQLTPIMDSSSVPDVSGFLINDDTLS